LPLGESREPEGFKDRGGKILRSLRRIGGVGPDFVGRADDIPAADPTTCEEDGLACAPVVSAGKFSSTNCRDAGSASELAPDDDEGLGEKASRIEVIKKCAQGAVQRREEMVF
jgi:hypothetical protein